MDTYAPIHALALVMMAALMVALNPVGAVARLEVGCKPGGHEGGDLFVFDATLGRQGRVRAWNIVVCVPVVEPVTHPLGLAASQTPCCSAVLLYLARKRRRWRCQRRQRRCAGRH